MVNQPRDGREAGDEEDVYRHEGHHNHRRVATRRGHDAFGGSDEASRTCTSAVQAPIFGGGGSNKYVWVVSKGCQLDGDGKRVGVRGASRLHEEPHQGSER